MIRVATEADIPALVEIESACFGSAAWSDSLIRQELAGDHHVVLIALRGRASDGYGAISVLGDVVDLDRIAVLPSRQRHGSARALLAALVVHARDRDATRMLLEVAADNTAARELYRSAGFAMISRRVGYYRGGVDALVMQLDNLEAS